MIPCQASRQQHQITLAWHSSIFLGVLLQLLILNTVVGRPMNATHPSMTAMLTSHRRDNTTIEATTITECRSYLRTADRNGDSKLSPMEYTEFVDELSGGAFRDVFMIPFDRLPSSLQSNFKALACPCFNDNSNSESNPCCSEGDGADSLATTSIDDLSINLSAQSQVSWLNQVCRDTQTAIENHIGVPTTTTAAPTTTTAVAPIVVPIPSLSECYSSLSLAINTANDNHDDDSLTAAEFVTFVNSLTNNQTWSGLQFTQLPTELKQVFLSRVDMSDTDTSFSMLHGYGQGQSLSTTTTSTVSGHRVAALRDFCPDTLMAMNKLNNVGELNVARQPTSAPVPDPTSRIPSPRPAEEEEEVVAAGDKLSTSPSMHPTLSSPLVLASDIISTSSPAVAVDTLPTSTSPTRHPASSTPLVVSSDILSTSPPSPVVTADSGLPSLPNPVVAGDSVPSSPPSPELIAADVLPTSSVVSAAGFPTPTAPLQVRTSPSSSPTIALNLCYVAMIVNDRDGNEMLDSSEYASFASKISGGQLSSVAYDDLPAALRNKFVDLSNGSADGIDIEGSRPMSTVDADQSAFLERICVEVDQAIDQALNPGPTMSPSVATDSEVTNQSASPVPAETETPTSRPNIPDSFPTLAAMPTRPSRRTRSPFSFGSPAAAPSLTAPAFASPSMMPSIGAASAPSSLKPSVTPTSPPTETLTTEPSHEPTSKATSSPTTIFPITSSSKPTLRSTPSPTTSIPTTSTSKPTVGSTPSPTTALPSKSSSTPTLNLTSAPTTALPTPSSSKPTVESTPDPTLEPTKEPTRIQTETLSGSPVTENLLFRPSPTTVNETSSVSMEPSQHVEGIKYYGNVTFTISNAARLDEDHLQSGMTRNHLTAAFRILVQNVTDRLFGPNDSRQLRRRERQRCLQQWLLSVPDTWLDRIENAPCPSGVPTDTLCEECYASFVVEAPAESSSSLSASADTKLIETELATAITNGELQRALDEVDPDTLVRIEEGQVRQRDDPVGVYTIAGTSFPNAAIIGCVVGCVVLLVLICLWTHCCGSGTGRRQKGPPKTDVYLSEGPQKPSGRFG